MGTAHQRREPCRPHAIFGTVDLPLWVIVASQCLHGFCFSFAVVGSVIYSDRLAPEHVQTSMQTVFMGCIGPKLQPVENP